MRHGTAHPFKRTRRDGYESPIPPSPLTLACMDVTAYTRYCAGCRNHTMIIVQVVTTIQIMVARSRRIMCRIYHFGLRKCEPGWRGNEGLADRGPASGRPRISVPNRGYPAVI